MSSQPGHHTSSTSPADDSVTAAVTAALDANSFYSTSPKASGSGSDTFSVTSVDGDDTNTQPILHEVAVHQMDVGSSLPTAEEIRNSCTLTQERKVRSFSRRTQLAVAAVVLGSALLGMILGVQRSKEVKTSTSSSDNTSNTHKDKNGVTHLVWGRPATFDAIEEYLLDQAVLSASLQPNTPQHQAVTWLATSQTEGLPFPDQGIADAVGYRYLARYVMAINYYALHGTTWNSQLNFLSELDVCEWEGVVLSKRSDLEKIGMICEPVTNIPIYFTLKGNSLDGSLPTENGLLTTLRSLNLEESGLSGTIPTELCQLTKLESLLMGHNSLTGSIPDCVGNSLTKLQKLYLNDNMLNGTVPKEMALLNKLEHLFVEDNFLTGDPTSVFNTLTTLEILIGHHNDFTGILDESFLQGHRALTWVDLSYNSFQLIKDEGLPVHLLSMKELEVLDLSSNRLAGHVPTDIPVNHKLKYLSLFENFMNGGIPSQLENLVALQHLDLSDNLFHGPIRHEIGYLSSLRFLFLGQNSQLQEGELPLSFANLTKLEEFSMRLTNRAGPLPDWLGSLTHLSLVDFSSNTLKGTIPDNYGDLSHLEFLFLHSNQNISGTLPNSFKALTKLRALFLDSTSISGNVGEVVCELPLFADPDGIEVAFADCAARLSSTVHDFECACCICCSPDELNCSFKYQLRLQNEWREDVQSMAVRFKNNTSFWDRGYIPPYSANLDGNE